MRKVMVVPEKAIFRQSAIMAYKRGREKDVVPRLISWPIIVCFWILLGVLIVSGLLAWDIQVPTYVDGSGIILTRADMPASRETVAVVFLPPDQSTHVRAGLPVQVQIGSAGVHVQGAVAQVEPGITSPEAARQRYQLGGVGTLLVTQPSIVLIIKIGTTLSATDYAGSLCIAKVEIGSQRLLALFPGLGQLLGGSS